MMKIMQQINTDRNWTLSIMIRPDRTCNFNFQQVLQLFSNEISFKRTLHIWIYRSMAGNTKPNLMGIMVQCVGLCSQTNCWYSLQTKIRRSYVRIAISGPIVHIETGLGRNYDALN